MTRTRWRNTLENLCCFWLMVLALLGVWRGSRWLGWLLIGLYSRLVSR